MAEFLPAFNRTLRREGGLVLTDDPDDHGERTYAGISERWHPSWPGWSLLNKGVIPGEVRVRAFYLYEFWVPLRCEEIPSQAIANELFDCAVNPGPRRAVAWLQEALNVYVASTLTELKVDGWMGPKTLAMLDNLRAEADDELWVLNAMRGRRAAFYERRAAEDPTQAKFLDGWLARARADDDKEAEA